MPKYKVTVEYRGKYETEVEASTEAEATMHAEEEADYKFSFSDLEITTSCEKAEEDQEDAK